MNQKISVQIASKNRFVIECFFKKKKNLFLSKYY